MNNRLFKTHHIRRSVLLDDLWEVSVPGKWKGRVPVPSCLETIPALSSYRGNAEYRTETAFGGNMLLTFSGVSHTAEVFFDGKRLGSHYGAYGAFSFAVPSVADGNHTVTVRADNSFHEDSALHIPNDYYSYLGITRPVSLELIPDVYITYVHFTPSRVNGHWQAEIELELSNIGTKDDTVFASVRVGDDALAMGECRIAAGQTRKITGILDAPHAQSYEKDRPVLYCLEAVLKKDGIPTDDLIDRVGFREIAIDGGRILMNGKPLSLFGFNRHEDYAEFGCALPLQAMMRDIELFRDLGADCVRTCHYPNDERFLDLCDEYGILVWEEGHSRGLDEKKMRHPRFMEQMSLSVSEMQNQHFNHPSIFVWGLLNECATYTEYGRGCCETLIRQIKETDPSRPVTYAGCWIGKDLCLEYADIVSYNMYPGWYTEDTVKEYIDRVCSWAKNAGGEGKPFIISEIGAGAVYGYHKETEDKWTEEYQDTLIREIIETCTDDPSVSAVFLWQFADCRVDPKFFAGRPKTENNKGIVDIYRRRKLAYRTVRELLKGRKQ